MHEGYWNNTLGLPGWPSAGEEMIVARNILLAEKTGTHVHCQHMTAAGSVRLIREARSRGVPVSGEACPHHFTLTDSAIAGSDKFWPEDGKGVFLGGNGDRPAWPEYDTNFKMNPPLRSAADREAVIEGVVDGTLEIIGSGEKMSVYGIWPNLVKTSTLPEEGLRGRPRRFSASAWR